MSHFSPDRRDNPDTPPLPEVVEKRTEIRRVSKRVRAPAAFYHVLDNSRALPLQLTLYGDEDGEILAECMLYDVNDGGIGFLSPDLLDVGDTGLMVAHHPGERDAVISGHVEILHGREARGLNQEDLPTAFRNQTLFKYGTRLTMDEVHGFYRATLESLALSMARRQA